MAWRRPGDKPLSEPMIVKLPTHIWVTRPQWVNLLLSSDKTQVINSMLPGRCCCDFKYINTYIDFKHNWGIKIFSIQVSINLQWLPDVIDSKLTHVLVVAWCHQATNHYLNQCWPSFIAPWVQSSCFHDDTCILPNIEAICQVCFTDQLMLF